MKKNIATPVPSSASDLSLDAVLDAEVKALDPEPAAPPAPEPVAFAPAEPAKTLVLRYVSGRNVWTHDPSGFSMCHWDDDAATRDQIHASAQKAAKTFFKLGESDMVAVHFDETTKTLPVEVPVEVKITNFVKV